MEELAIKIAETLDISVQGAIDMYPVIRSQYIWYQTLYNVSLFALFMGLGALILIGATYIIRDDTDKFYWDTDKGYWNTEKITEEWVSIDKLFKKARLALLVFVVIGIVASRIIPFLAPDIMLLKGLLG